MAGVGKALALRPESREARQVGGEPALLNSGSGARGGRRGWERVQCKMAGRSCVKKATKDREVYISKRQRTKITMEAAVDKRGQEVKRNCPVGCLDCRACRPFLNDLELWPRRRSRRTLTFDGKCRRRRFGCVGGGQGNKRQARGGVREGKLRDAPRSAIDSSRSAARSRSR